jgi:hypothetical protein
MNVRHRSIKLPNWLIAQVNLWGPGLLFVAITVMVYYDSLSCFFYHDDLFLIHEVKRLSLLEFVEQSFSSSTALPANLAWLFRPVPHYLYFFTGYQLFGLAAGPYHIFHLIFHTVNAWLVYRLVARATLNKRAGFISAMLFVSAVRVHFESIFWVSGMVEVGMTFFMLISLNLYLETPDRFRSRTLLGAISTSSYALALLSKETAIILPVLLLMLELLRERRQQKELWSRPSRRFTGFFAGHVVVTLLYLAFRVPRLLQAAGSSSSYAASFDIGGILDKYLWGLIWSVDTILELWWRITNAVPSLPLFWPSILAFFASVIGSVLWLLHQANRPERRRWLRALVLWGMWFVLGLSPVVLTPAFAAYLFMWPSIGLFALLSLILDKTLQRPWGQHHLQSRCVLFALSILLLVSALLKVNDLNRSAWPSKYAALNQTTIHRVMELRPTLPQDSCIYLTGFPSKTWSVDTAPFIFRVFYKREDLDVLLESDASILSLANRCPHVFVFAYTQGQVEEIPYEQSKVDTTSEEQK